MVYSNVFIRQLIAAVVIFLPVAAAAQAPATCSLDPAFISGTKTGIYPDSTINFGIGVSGQPYGQNITIKIPKDTVQGPVRICFNRFEVSTPGGYTNFNLPPGLSFLAGPTVTVSNGTFQYPGFDNSCSVISGTPTVPGSYTVQFKVTAYGTPVASNVSCPASPNVTQGIAVSSTTLSYYVIKIYTTVGLKEDAASKAMAPGAVPNPFNNKTALTFFAQDQSSATIFVYNLLGKKMLEETVRTVPGINRYDLDAQGWNSGVYLYSIQYKDSSETRKIILNKNE